MFLPPGYASCLSTVQNRSEFRERENPELQLNGAANTVSAFYLLSLLNGISASGFLFRQQGIE